MHTYTLSTVSKRTGLSTHVLRAWEKRYNVVEPSRAANNRRVYSDQDLERLVMLSQLVKAGQSIGTISTLSDQELLRLSENMQPALSETSGFDDFSIVSLSSSLVSQVVVKIQNYDLKGCTEILSGAILGMQIDELMDKVCSPIMIEVGELWAKGKINSAQEHILCSAFQSLIMPKIRSSVIKDQAPSITFATWQNEPHQMGLMFAACMASARGLNTYFLGADLPLSEIAQSVQKTKSKILGLSIVLPISQKTFIFRIRRLLKVLPKNCEIWVGGYGSVNLNCDTLPARVLLLKHDTYVTELNNLSDL